MADPSPDKPVVKKVTPPEMPLDWTKLGESADKSIPLRYPHDVAEISAEETDVIVVGTAGQKITFVGKDFSSRCNPQMQQLILRSHLIKTMEGLENFKQLELLELYDNMIDGLACLEGPGPTLRTLDMSYNVIKDMSPVSLCTNLQELYLANNKLKKIEGLSALTKLRKIDLGANRIRVMDENELGGLVNLEELWIGKNKIEEIGGLEKLTKLRRLDVQSNRLTKVENLTSQQGTLEELYLSHNAIDDEGAFMPTGLQLSFPNLNVVDMCRNRLTSTSMFAHLEGLEELWISGNLVDSFDGVEPLRDAPNQKLETVYLEYNPVASEFEYRKRLAEWIPSLKQIDATLIGGLAAHGYPSTAIPSGRKVESMEQQLRRLQDAAIRRAKEETEGKHEIIES